MKNKDFFIKILPQEIKNEISGKTPAFFVLLVLLSIPLLYTINSIAVALLFLSTLIYYKKGQFVYSNSLLYPILLYFVMLLSFFWTIDKSSTIPALSKELSLLAIPVCFLLFGGIAKEKRQLILKYYSHGIVVYAFYYLIKASIRFFLTKDTSVFFYHELVTKDVHAVHVSVYMATSFFYFLSKPIKKGFDFVALAVLLLMVILLSSSNIIIAFIGLVLIYFLFYAKAAKQMRLKNMIVLAIILFSLGFVGKFKEQLRKEYETIMTDSTVNDVISKENNNTFFNVSIKQAWTNKTFKPNDFFPGTAFRVYQFRIFLEMMCEDAIFWTGYGLNASYSKIEEKAKEYHIYLGNKGKAGYQNKNFHNQYVQNFAELGIFGFILLLLMLIVNVKIAYKSKDFVHFAFAFLMISLFLTESFLWRQRGVVFFTTLYCLFNSGMPQIHSKAE